MLQICIDVGGTFTDCLVLDPAGGLHKFKASTTPSDPTAGLMHAVSKAGRFWGKSLPDFLADVDLIVHGTTLGTNTLITGTGARVGMLTTKGFRDVTETRLGIKNLHGSMFEQFVEPYQPLVPRHLRRGVTERVLYTGAVATPLAEDEVQDAVRRLVDAGCEAVAICFLHSYANPANEQQARAIVQAEAPGLYVTTSHEILPVWREFERFSTTVVSAYIGPKIGRYLRKLQGELREQGFRGSLLLMQANALVQTPEYCADRAIYVLDSGPAAAPSGARYLGGLHGRTNLLSVDMGGTSFDICMIKDGVIPTSTDKWVGEERVAIKMVDIASIGAGGGSIAWIDSLGLLRVGPQSAGADPGPAAYGKGEDATVADANLVLGYIPADYFLGGEMQVDVDRSRQAIARVGERLGMDVDQAAEAVYTTINQSMANAITEVCTKKGHDVRTFTMVAGGGAGGVHAAAIARRLSIPEVIVPRTAALMSAFGMYMMDIGQEFARSRFGQRGDLDAAEVETIYAEMRQEAVVAFQRMGVAADRLQYRPTVDMRYAGQFHEIEVDLPAGTVTEASLDQLLLAFHQKYEQLYKYAMPWMGTEFLTFRLRVSTPRRTLDLAAADTGAAGIAAALRGHRTCRFAAGALDTAIYDWDQLRPGHSISGPAVVVDRTTSVLVPPDTTGTVDPYGNLVLRPAHNG